MSIGLTIILLLCIFIIMDCVYLLIRYSGTILNVVDVVTHGF